MPMRHDDHDDTVLDPFFDAARDAAPAPTEDMLARVLADAETIRTAALWPAPRHSWTTRVRHLLGGWPTMAGLTTAALAGLWIGAGLPDRVIGTDEARYLVDITPEMAFDLGDGDD